MDRCMWFPYTIMHYHQQWKNLQHPQDVITLCLIIVSSKENERDVKYKIGSYLKEDLCFFFRSYFLVFYSLLCCDDYGNILCIVYIMDL